MTKLMKTLKLSAGCDNKNLIPRCRQIEAELLKPKPDRFTLLTTDVFHTKRVMLTCDTAHCKLMLQPAVAFSRCYQHCICNSIMQ